MMETIMIKSEPTSEEDEEVGILPDPLELPIQVKTDVTCKRELGLSLNDNQENLENKNNQTKFVPEKTLVHINGVLYLLEKIPDDVVQESQTEKAVTYTSENPLDKPVSCPQCGKILKRRKNLKIHMQVCSNSLSYNCTFCPYKTNNANSLDFHFGACKNRNTSQAVIDSNEDLFSRVCPKCNISMPLETKACIKCGSLNRWQCKKCSKHFENFSTVRHHYKTTCKPVSYYHCRKCDYRSAFNLHILAHIRRKHPELKSSGSLKYVRKITTGVNEVKHLCSKCGKIFDEADKLNRHTCFCKASKYEKPIEKIENSDSCQTDSSIELTCFKQSFKCDNCNFETDSKEKLIQHQRNLHGDISATCTNCGKYFTNSTLFMWHVASCGTSNVLYCDKCPYTALKKDHIQRHMISFHGQSNASKSNSIANSNFSSIQPRIQSFCVKCQRRQQMHDRAKFCKICRSELQFRCLTCNKMFSIDKSKACAHVNVHLRQLGLECQRCGRRFSDRSKYKLHVESCGKTRRHNCELCSYSTRFVNHLQKHKLEAHYMSIVNDVNTTKKKRSSQSRKCTDKSETVIVDLKEEICLKMDEDSDSSQFQGFGEDAKNSSLMYYKNFSANKLNLQCKVVLTRLKM